jgi:membrane protein
MRTRPNLSAEQHDQLDWLMQALYTTWRLFTKNELQNHAAATAFYFLLSAAPLVLLMMYAMQYLAHLAETSNLATMMMAALYEQFSLARLIEVGLIPQKAQVAAGGVGLITLLLSSRGLLNALQSAFRVIFPEEAKRKFVLNWLLPLIIIPLVFGVVIVAVALQTMLTFFMQIDLLGAGKAIVFKTLNIGFATLSVWGMLYLALRRLPLKRPPIRATLLISFLATLTLAALFMGFNHFFRIEKYQAVYGAIGGVVFVLIGAYLACITFYFWAQFLYATSKVDVAALEKLFLHHESTDSSKLDAVVFGRANRLLAKYGQTFNPGDTLIHEGDSTREAILVHAGKVGVYKQLEHGERKLVELGAGSLVGEMSYLLNEKRTATIRAESEVVAIVLPPHMLEELMQFSAPLSRQIISTLAQRLMRMNQVTSG